MNTLQSLYGRRDMAYTLILGMITIIWRILYGILWNIQYDGISYLILPFRRRDNDNRYTYIYIYIHIIIAGTMNKNHIVVSMIVTIGC